MVDCINIIWVPDGSLNLGDSIQLGAGSLGQVQDQSPSLLSSLPSPSPAPLWLVPTLSWSRPVLTFHTAAAPQPSGSARVRGTETWPFLVPVAHTLGGRAGQLFWPSVASLGLTSTAVVKGTWESWLPRCRWLALWLSAGAVGAKQMPWEGVGVGDRGPAEVPGCAPHTLRQNL